MTDDQAYYDATGDAVLLKTAVEAWSERNDDKPQGNMVTAGQSAVNRIDGMSRELYQLRTRLTGELRVNADKTMERTAVLLACYQTPQKEGAA